LLRASHPDIREYLEKSIRNSFDCKESTTIGIGQKSQTFIGNDLSRTDKGFKASMRTYIARLSELAADSQFNEYRRTRAKLVWICNSKPDICAFVSQCSSITSENFTTKDIKTMNDRVRYLKKTNDKVELNFPTLEKRSLHLLVYTYASISTREDKSSKGGYACLLADKSKRCCFLDYNSGKLKRIARCSMAAEISAFGNAFDVSFTLREEESALVGHRIPMLMLTDSAGLFDSMTRYKRTTEGRL
jgi:hypothetical protein